LGALEYEGNPMTLNKYDWVLAAFLTVCAATLVFGAGLGVMLALGGATINWH
jgi:hypothetical protein